MAVLLLQAGGEVQRRRITDLSELAAFDLVINCLGLGAKHLFHDDKLFPVRYDRPICPGFTIYRAHISNPRHPQRGLTSALDMLTGITKCRR